MRLRCFTGNSVCSRDIGGRRNAWIQRLTGVAAIVDTNACVLFWYFFKMDLKR